MNCIKHGTPTYQYVDVGSDELKDGCFMCESENAILNLEQRIKDTDDKKLKIGYKNRIALYKKRIATCTCGKFARGLHDNSCPCHY